MNFKWLVCLPFILVPDVMALAQQMPISDSCVESMEDDFAEDTVLLCPSPLPPVKSLIPSPPAVRMKPLAAEFTAAPSWLTAQQ